MGEDENKHVGSCILLIGFPNFSRHVPSPDAKSSGDLLLPLLARPFASPIPPPLQQTCAVSHDISGVWDFSYSLLQHGFRHSL